MSGKKKTKKINKNDPEIWTEEQYEQYMKGLYSLDFIVGYTEGGVPYGTPMKHDTEEIVENSYNDEWEELPFS